MIITEDSKEKHPLEFDNPMIERVERKHIGIPNSRFSVDYGVRFKDGHCPQVFFERKSLPDLFGTMGVGYKRFKRKMMACKDAGVTMILIVEGTFSKVQQWDNPKNPRQVLTGQAMVKKLCTLWHRYGLLTVYCKSRVEMAEYITRFYISLGQEYLRKQGKRRLG